MQRWLLVMIHFVKCIFLRNLIFRDLRHHRSINLIIWSCVTRGTYIIVPCSVKCTHRQKTERQATVCHAGELQLWTGMASLKTTRCTLLENSHAKYCLPFAKKDTSSLSSDAHEEFHDIELQKLKLCFYFPPLLHKNNIIHLLQAVTLLFLRMRKAGTMTYSQVTALYISCVPARVSRVT